MAQLTSPRTTYSDTTPQKRAIADLIEIITPSETPLLKYLGYSGMGKGGEALAAKFQIRNWPSTKIEWLEDTLASIATTLGASLAATASSVTEATTVAAANVLREGHVILADSEYMLVRNVSSDSITVTRMYGGSSGSHASAATVDVVSNARDQGDDSDDSFTTDITAPFNYTQIFQDEIWVSRTQQKITQYGIQSEWDYQISKTYLNQMRFLEKTFFHGQRKAGGAATGAGTTNPAGTGGFDTFITDNTASHGSAALTQKALEDRIQACWEDGGTPNLIVCNGWLKRKITGFYVSSVRREEKANTGGVVIDSVETDFGQLGVMLNRHCPASKLYVLSTDYIGMLPLDSFFFEPLAKDGDYEKGQVVGEYGIVVKNDKAHASLSSISTTK